MLVGTLYMLDSCLMVFMVHLSESMKNNETREHTFFKDTAKNSAEAMAAEHRMELLDFDEVVCKGNLTINYHSQIDHDNCKVGCLGVNYEKSNSGWCSVSINCDEPRSFLLKFLENDILLMILTLVGFFKLFFIIAYRNNDFSTKKMPCVSPQKTIHA